MQVVFLGRMILLSEALELARRGFPVFPLSPNTKIPLKGSQGVKDASTDEIRIKTAWATLPRANIGVALGKNSGIVAIDVDRNHGATEADFAKFPRTVTVRTRNGRHFYYKYPLGGVKSHVVTPGTNGDDKQAAAYLRSDGYYVVGPYSVVSWQDGNTLTPWEYDFHEDAGGRLSFADCPLADLPEWCCDPGPRNESDKSGCEAGNNHSVGGPANGKDHQSEWQPVTYPENTRHASLLKAATAMHREGKSREEIRARLHKYNQEKCQPPKPPEVIGPEIEGIVKWVVEKVPLAQPNQAGAKVTQGVCQSVTTGTGATGSDSLAATGSDSLVNESEFIEFIIPLGHRDTDYYYTSSSNRQIVTISRGSHNMNSLLDLMPLDYWAKKYGKEKGGVDSTRACADLMEECRDTGIFDDRKMRGLGCWNDGGKLVVHLGDRLFVDGKVLPLNQLASKYIYALSVSMPDVHKNPLPNWESLQLVQAANALKWRDTSHGILLAGFLAVFRLCGALAWRPMVWLTGPSGSGKTTVTEQIVSAIAGAYGVSVMGATTEAGLRQELFCDSRPVIYDEAETGEGQRSHNRMRSIIELIRQASSNSASRIYKGTADGKGHTFNINSAFLLASIRVNLTEEADLNRFSILELDRNDPSQWPVIKKLLDPIDNQFGDRLFARMVEMYPVLLANIKLFENLIAETTDRRTGQQYGALLAGFGCLVSDVGVTEEYARHLISRIGALKPNAMSAERDSDEVECLNHLLTSTVRVDLTDQSRTLSIAELLSCGGPGTSFYEHHVMLGLDRDETHVYVACSHSGLKKLFFGTKWQDNWTGALSRLKTAKRSERHYFAARQLRCVKIPTGLLSDK